MGANQVDSNHFGLVCEVAKPNHLPMCHALFSHDV